MMITQSVHFEISGQDARFLLEFCQKTGKQPQDVFEQFLHSLIGDDSEKPQHRPIKKSSYAGGLAKFANPALMDLEEMAVAHAIKVKYDTD